ncbi:hypothetical protein GCM10011585_22780 [Edaphobacter dinghuensis]|uniref:Uncharacterized protein n=1 Tax=Edaphobacter dinghuensis TaxID=1560005 RepID=A0A917HHR4_9BACT|nr:hypothetical protein GCM10011585_22780 [Edaphobacter dinghuensis]
MRDPNLVGLTLVVEIRSHSRVVRNLASRNQAVPSHLGQIPVSLIPAGLVQGGQILVVLIPADRVLADRRSGDTAHQGVRRTASVPMIVPIYTATI